MRREDVQIWLDRYIAAWSSYDETAIGDLFAEEAEYRYQPWGEPVRGRAEIVRAWVAPEGNESGRDDPDSWTAHYDVWAFDGERADAIGESRYTNPDGSLRNLYYNHFALRFDGHGKCVEFVEYFMELPERLHEGR
jgi:SnoaL-like domain